LLKYHLSGVTEFWVKVSIVTSFCCLDFHLFQLAKNDMVIHA